MLHPINLPASIEALWTVVTIQEMLLESACTQPLDRTTLNSRFDSSTVSWLVKRNELLLKPLEEFVAHGNQTEKRAIIEAFRHDTDYHNHLEDHSFAFQLQPKSALPSPLAVKVGKWLENFYDVMVRFGIPKEVTDYPSSITQQLILDEFNKINAGMYVCPACDGTWMEPTSTGIYGSIDHFLPRSKYPALSVHPFNLIPICMICNEKLKEDKDPLADNQPRTLADAFVFCGWCNPARPARDSAVCHIDSSMTLPWVLQCGQATPVQLSLLPDIFDLPGRWQNRSDEIDRIVRRRLRDSMDALSITATTISLNEFHAVLKRLEQRMRKEWGEDPFLYPATWWLRWLHQYKFNALANDFLGQVK